MGAEEEGDMTIKAGGVCTGCGVLGLKEDMPGLATLGEVVKLLRVPTIGGCPTPETVKWAHDFRVAWVYDCDSCHTLYEYTPATHDCCARWLDESERQAERAPSPTLELRGVLGGTVIEVTARDLGVLVRCLNCRGLWRRITNDTYPLPSLDDIQLVCPVCGSNAYQVVPDES